jgi:hypothetical protein
MRRYSTLISILMLLALSASLPAAKKDKDKENDAVVNLPAVIWRDPGDVASLNLLYGAGGKAHAPDPNGRFTFVKEDTEGTSPKFDITDKEGVQWTVKLGREPQSETAATRFVWAAGYFVDEDYYLANLKVMDMPRLHRGRNFVSADGIVHKARLERKSKDGKKIGTWDWFANPLQGKRELNGLRVMMALVNDWDLKTVNNSIYEAGDERRYVVSDLGASFGNTGSSFSRSSSSPRDYARSKFVEKTRLESVDFVMHSRPFFLSVINVPYYLARTRMELITKRIPRADARWLGHRLAMLSEEQVRDGFRAGGYTPEETEIFTRAMRKRIAELAAL